MAEPTAGSEPCVEAASIDLGVGPRDKNTAGCACAAAGESGTSSDKVDEAADGTGAGGDGRMMMQRGAESEAEADAERGDPPTGSGTGGDAAAADAGVGDQDREVASMTSEDAKQENMDEKLLEELRREEIRKGKQKAPSSEVDGSSSPDNGDEHEDGAGAKSPSELSVPALHVPWEKKADREPQKLPIRFKDCVGRTFVLPWKKVRTWKGMKKLIDSAFSSVDILAPSVAAGHYDLVAWEMFADDQSGKINPSLSSYPQTSSAPSSSASPTASPWGPNFAHSVPPTTLPSTYIVPHPNPSTGNPPDGFLSARSAVVLPELWEDIVEPGMMIHMLMWPPARTNAPAPVQPQMYLGHAPAPATGMAPGAAGFGRGSAAPPPGQTWMPPPPPAWTGPPMPMPMPMRHRPLGDALSAKRKGKTRKRPL